MRTDTVFDTFPWPQTPTKAQIAEVAVAAVALRALRRDIMGRLKYSLRDLYRTLEEPGANPLREAHTRLDTAVRAAYGMNPVAAISDRRGGGGESREVGGRASRKLPPDKATDAQRAPLQPDPLAFLLALNLTLATKEKAGEPITPPGLPLPETDRTAFITDDCVKVTEP